MEPDRQFVEALDMLREAHQNLRLACEREVAELKAEVAQLREPAAPPVVQKVVSWNGAEDDEAGSVPRAPDEEAGSVPRAPDAAENDAAKSESTRDRGSTESFKKRRSKSVLHLTLHQKEKLFMDRLWEHFDGFIGFAIMLYTAVMFLGLHIEGVKNGKRLLHESPPEFSAATDFVNGMNHAFNALFLLEFVIRIYFFRLRYFYDGRIQYFNLFDSSLVWLTILEAYVFTKMSLSFSCIRVVRIIRLLRSLRVVRTFRFFTHLRVLVSTVAASYMALVWSMILLSIVMLIGALSLCQLLSSSVIDEGLDLETRRWVHRYYGTPGRSLYTMFELTFSGGWPNYARTIVEEVSVWYVLFFIGYIGGVVFAMTRIITALFLKDTLAIASNDADAQINAKMKEKQTYARKLHEFFEEADTSGDGFISKLEFTAMLQEPRAAAYLAFLEIDASESLQLFQVIDDGDGRISSEEFVKSALRLKGCARAQDLVIMMHELYKVKKDVKHMHEVAKNTHHLTHKIHNIHADRNDRDLNGIRDADRADKDLNGTLYPSIGQSLVCV